MPNSSVKDVNAILRTVYGPNDVATYTMDEIVRRRKEKHYALGTGVGTIDHYMRPVMPGETIFVLAHTSNGKTSFMQFWARQVVGQLQRRETADEVVVYISWETLVEELGLYDLCGMTGIDGTSAWYGDVTDPEVERLRVASMRRAGMPLWVMGDSLKRRRELDGISMPVVSDAMKRLETEWGIRPAIIFLDYLQKITPENWKEDRRIQVLRNCDHIYQLARDCGCPVIVGSQAGREVMGRDFKLPEIGDGQETSRQEQDADKVLSLWYPCKSEPLGSEIPELDVEVTKDLMVMGIRKQRHAESGQVFPLRFDAARNVFASWPGSQLDENDREPLPF
jgi:replicative DNA helicase